MAEKCKPCEIYRKLYDVFGKTCLSKEKIHQVETYWLYGKKNVSVAAFSKEGRADSFPGHEWIYLY